MSIQHLIAKHLRATQQKRYQSEKSVRQDLLEWKYSL